MREIRVSKERLLEVMRYLRDHTGYECKSIIDIIGVDKGGLLEVVYVLRSVRYSGCVEVKVELKEGEVIESIGGLYRGSNWLEREVYDMFGIEFVGHEDLRRLLTDYGFEGNALRKGYPLTGYSEVGYNEERKGVEYRRIK